MKSTRSSMINALVLLLCGCAVDPTLDPISVSDIISFDPSSASGLSIPADGVTTIPIKVNIVADGDQKVTFTTEQGSFQGTGASSNKKTIDVTTEAKSASATLIADQTLNDAVAVTASVTKDAKTYTTTTYVKFTESYPESIVLTSDKNVIKADQNTTATITVNVLKTANKKVSAGLLLTVKVEPADLADVVTTAKLSSEPMNTPITFTVRSKGTATGVVKITASSGGVSGVKELTLN